MENSRVRFSLHVPHLQLATPLRDSERTGPCPARPAVARASRNPHPPAKNTTAVAKTAVGMGGNRVCRRGVHGTGDGHTPPQCARGKGTFSPAVSGPHWRSWPRPDKTHLRSWARTERSYPAPQRASLVSSTGRSPFHRPSHRPLRQSRPSPAPHAQLPAARSYRRSSKSALSRAASASWGPTPRRRCLLPPAAPPP